MNVRTLGLLLLSLLLVSGGLWIRSYYTFRFHEQLIRAIQKNIDNELLIVDKEAGELLGDLAMSSPAWDRATHFFIHVDSNQMVGWNRTDFLPDLVSITTTDTITYLKSVRGDMVVRKWAVRDGSSLFCVLKLTDQYPIINNFLSAQWESAIFPAREIRIVDPITPSGNPVFVNGRVLFKIWPPKPEVHESIWSFTLLLTGLLAFLTFVWRFRQWMQKAMGYDAAFLGMLLVFLALRYGMIAVNFPALYYASDVFDPKKFASSSLNASLGDLLFNSVALLILVVYFFLNFRKFRVVHYFLNQTGLPRYLLGSVCLLLCFYAFLFPFDFIETIYHNSTLAFDGTQSLSLDSVRLSALCAVLTGCISSFLFIHAVFSLSTHLFDKKNRLFFSALFLASILFILQFYWLDRNLWVTMILGIIFFSGVKISGMNRGVFRFSFRLFVYLIFSLILYSFQNAWAVRIFYKEKQTQDQIRFGKDFLTERDVLGEYLLNQTRQRIQRDQFIQVRMASPFLNKTAVVDKVRRVHLSNYFDRYETKIMTWNEEESGGAKHGFDSVTTKQGSFLPTGYEGISYASAADGTTVKQYHVKAPIFYQRPVGVVELDLSLKRVIPDNVYPELLVDNRFKQIYRNRNFSYAVFTDEKLATSSGPFNYERDFSIDWIGRHSLYDKGLTDGNYNHIGIEETDGSVAIVSALTYSWFYFITNFSFWFVLGLVLLFTWLGAYGVYTYLIGENVNYTTRIQSFIFLSFLLPVLAVSITTLTLIGRSNEETIRKDYLERSGTVSQRLTSVMSADSASVWNQANIEKWIVENAASSRIDISVYSPNGILVATSQPALFDNQLISPLISREAWKKIVLQGEAQTVTDERIGSLPYSCAYSAIVSPGSGKLEGIVGLPFFESAANLEKSQALILSNILIVFVVVFVLFSFLSFWASSNLTFPIRFITKGLSQTTLAGENKPLRWRSSDEIGTLVKEYNKMVGNLDESKKALARSEKEAAWREMAKQVAHEIKNPLTPMKLTLQQMEQALSSGTLPEEKTKKSVDVLLKQVEMLNEIAESFSSFANMPSPSPQKVNFHELLQSTVNLFGAESAGKVSYYPGDPSFVVLVDRTSFSRAISNIIINALQAKRDGQTDLEVSIRTHAQGDTVVIAIQDNGKGMSDEVMKKAFQPQFTTKHSGSGLGLAMAQQIARQAGGKISFESVQDKGTTFFVELPLADRA
jgi:two-component system nitrogen regulation sensor histidine kinase NtrY